MLKLSSFLSPAFRQSSNVAMLDIVEHCGNSACSGVLGDEDRLLDPISPKTR